jgi:phosphoglycolate phosphatase
MNGTVPFPLIVLDCDGTLVDSQLSIHAIMTECFTTHGLVAPDIAAVRKIVGLSLDDAIARLQVQPCETHPSIMSDTYRRMSSRLRLHGAFEEPLFPGAREAIEHLSESGCVLGIATGKSLNGLRNTLASHGLGHFFTTLQTSDQAPSKPHPAMLLQAMRDVGAEPHATVMVGDTTYDMEMARAAGTYAIGVAWGYHEAEALREAGAHRILESYADLASAVGEIFAENGLQMPKDSIVGDQGRLS